VVECVRRSVDIYFERLKLKRLFLRNRNAFKRAPESRPLQKAGFKYLKTHMTRAWGRSIFARP